MSDFREQWIQAVYFNKRAKRLAASIALVFFAVGFATGWWFR